MCFSATASFIAGGGLSAAGAITLREAKSKSRIPVAAMPLVFGIQQLVEGVVWISKSIPSLQNAASFVYVLFAVVLWPTYVPYAVMALEAPGRRKSILKGFTVFGASLSLWLFWYVVQAPVSADLAQRCVIYNVNVPQIPYGLVAYIFVTCFSCFFSSHKFIRLFGITLLGSLAIAVWSYSENFYSVWCFFAAILSLIIWAHLREGVRLWPLPVKQISKALSDAQSDVRAALKNGFQK